MSHGYRRCMCPCFLFLGTEPTQEGAKMFTVTHQNVGAFPPFELRSPSGCTCPSVMTSLVFWRTGWCWALRSDQCGWSTDLQWLLLLASSQVWSDWKTNCWWASTPFYFILFFYNICFCILDRRVEIIGFRTSTSVLIMQYDLFLHGTRHNCVIMGRVLFWRTWRVVIASYMLWPWCPVLQLCLHMLHPFSPPDNQISKPNSLLSVNIKPLYLHLYWNWNHFKRCLIGWLQSNANLSLHLA